MKIKLTLAAAGALACAALGAAPLSVPTAVQSKPDPASPVIAVLAAGTEQPAASPGADIMPAGWVAVELPGPFTGYVKNKDLSKQLDVIPGSPVYIGPKESSGVLELFAKGDKAEITGLRGGWTQIRLAKTLVGYISTAAPTAAAPTLADVGPATAPPAASAAAPMASSAPPIMPPTGDVALSKLFEGTLSSARGLFSAKRPYKWQLNDASGAMIAYVDLSKLLMTDQIENYAGRPVVVLGSLQPVKETGDLVIEVEAFHLK